MSTFKKGAAVRYQSARGSRSGHGKIKAIHQTGRGVWYEVEDTADKTTIKVRAAQLSPGV